MENQSNRRGSVWIRSCVLFLLLPGSCGMLNVVRNIPTINEEPALDNFEKRTIAASNAFFYYRDLAAAERFYKDVLGMTAVADYGFAKVLRIARTSYLTLVDARSGMHSADEPKTVAIALITDELDEWYRYLTREKVKIRSAYNPVAGRPHHGFVAYDPEGYYLEFERFNPHPENDRLLPMLNAMKSVYPEAGAGVRCPINLGFKATVLWLYYRDLKGIELFWGDIMGFKQVVDQGWAKIYAVSATGFLGPVDSAKGMHSWTGKKAVTVSLITDDLAGWFDHLKSQKTFDLKTPAIAEEKRAGARIFYGYDPEGYLIEFDTFGNVPANERLLELFKKSEGR